VVDLKVRGARIEAVRPGSPAEIQGLEAGDIILDLNGQRIRDLIDYQYLSAEDRVSMTVMKPDGSARETVIERDERQDWGISFDTLAFDGMKKCSNKCIFCFIDQLPPGMRDSLYEKDDDYRWSFFSGSFITLTNLNDRELERIRRYRLSPLYVSVHATEPGVREDMLGSQRAGGVLRQLRSLLLAGIELHLQVVLCPGVNDGEQLERTLGDLYRLGPGIVSVGLVPVGLTRFREGLPRLRAFTREEARVLIGQAGAWQERSLNERGSRWVFVADEFYLLAGAGFPPAGDYEGYPQLENGIGLASKFVSEFERLREGLPKRIETGRRVLVLTGESGYQVLRPIVDELNRIENLEVKLKPIVNRFFGGGVKVTGLLTGKDIIEGVGDEKGFYDLVVIPEVVLKNDTSLLLDDYSVEDLELKTGRKFRSAPVSASGLLEAVLGFKVSRKRTAFKTPRRLRGCIE
jgi:putative radical SAM enzyme (TIGR03279 family)